MKSRSGRRDGMLPEQVSEQLDELQKGMNRVLDHLHREAAERRERSDMRSQIGLVALNVLFLILEFSLDPPLYRTLLQHWVGDPRQFLVTAAGVALASLSAISVLERYFPDVRGLPPFLLPGVCALLAMFSTIALLVDTWVGLWVASVTVLNLAVACLVVCARLLNDWRQEPALGLRLWAGTKVALAATFLLIVAGFVSRAALSQLPAGANLDFEAVYLVQILLALTAAGLWLKLRRTETEAGVDTR